MNLRDHLRSLGLSSAEARRALATGKVFVDGIPTADGGRTVVPAQCELRPNAPRIKPGRDLVIVHQDDDVVVVWKPSGLLAVPARKADGHLNVLGLVRKLTGAALAVHRIDQPTSGLMMVARNEEAQEQLKAQLEVHSVERRYLALVSGTPREEEWTKESHLAVNRGDGRRGSIPRATDDSKYAKTHFQTLDTPTTGITLVEAQLETGRTHQVRIHLSEARLPILGDANYAPRPVALLAPRLCLHAAVLGFRHPKTGQNMRFEAPLPDDMNQLIRSLAIPEPEKPSRPERAPTTDKRPTKSKKRPTRTKKRARSGKPRPKRK